MTKISSGIKFVRYRFWDFFPVPILSDTNSETFSRYQIFPMPVPRLFSVPICSNTGSDNAIKNEKFPVPVRRTLVVVQFPAFCLLEVRHVLRWILLFCSLPGSEDWWQYLHGLMRLSWSLTPLIRIFLAGRNNPILWQEIHILPGVVLCKMRFSSCTVDIFIGLLLSYCMNWKTTAPTLKDFQRIIQWKVASQVFCQSLSNNKKFNTEWLTDCDAKNFISPGTS